MPVSSEEHVVPPRWTTFREAEYMPLEAMLSRFGATCSASEFYWEVNEAFHAAEAELYDTIHSDMFMQLSEVWTRLLRRLPSNPEKLAFLDVGCGTGLVGSLVSALCPERVHHMHLLDISEKMLQKCAEKSKRWTFSCTLQHGDVHSLDGEEHYDVVTLSSVLHHIVELQPFLRKIQDLIRPMGKLITAQDPRTGADFDGILRHREALSAARTQRRNLLRRHLGKLPRAIMLLLRMRRCDRLCAKTNDYLLSSGVIRSPMDLNSIWAVTDFHVPNQTGGYGKGISVEALCESLTKMRVDAIVTYDFLGNRWSNLTEAERSQSLKWLDEGDQHGRELASVWSRVE